MSEKAWMTARGAVSRFADALEESPGFTEDLAREYNRLKKALAVTFQEMALSAVPRDQFRLTELKKAVQDKMRSLFEGKVDSSFFVVRGYTTPHPDLFALLAANVREEVPGWRIRLLSGDKIHTERRTRELRDLGLEIEVTGDDENTLYRLTSLEPDLTYGAAFQLRKNAIDARAASRETKAYVVEIAEAAAKLPERKTSL